jgi:hypothetical protein
VRARNIIGYGDYSLEVTILAAQIADKPTDLVNVPAITLADQIGLSWVAPVFNGGSPVLDYAIWYDNAGQTYIELVNGLTSASYTATGLTQGLTYKFKVETRNAYGYGFFSDVLTVLAA